MMVTFISQCEKNALKKTRKVLDAFANRIGDNTWQTVITEDGLEMVKRLLRKTASKSTAVSCHWIRSRSRSQLLWIVGVKDRFNQEGIVAVNYTSKTLITDEGNFMNQSVAYLANTHKQVLVEHLFAVGVVSYELVKRLIPKSDSDLDGKLANAVFLAGCLHDIGKIDPEFQEYLSKQISKKAIETELPEDGIHIEGKPKFSFEKYPRHNELSLLLFQNINTNKVLNASNVTNVEHAIYWHHAKPIRKEDFSELKVIYKKFIDAISTHKYQDFIDVIKGLIVKIKNLNESYFEDCVDCPELAIDVVDFNEDQLYKADYCKPLPAYKKYNSAEKITDYKNDILINANRNIIRACVISADRLVSSLSASELTNHIENQTLKDLCDFALLNDRGLLGHIKHCLAQFDEKYPDSARNIAQKNTAQALQESTDDVAVLNGPAGCGKTKIALEWALNTGAKKIIWVCPRVQICQGLLNDLSSAEYLPQAKIEICTGEFKYYMQDGIKTELEEAQAFSGDIVLTTIDQVINTIITHKKVTGLISFMSTHIVFDEYHEYINMPAFNLLFAELVEIKKMQGKEAKTLLVSATPNYYFVKDFLEIRASAIVNMPSFNQSRYKIEFAIFDEGQKDTNPLFALQPKNSIVISNTAITAQTSFIENQDKENALLLHSKFTKKDKAEIFDKVFSTFKQNGSREFDLLRSGPIVQASLNITCDHMVTEFTHAENWLQRLGRLDRFGERKEINHYITAIPASLANKKENGACARFLSRMFSLQSAKAWYQFLQDKEIDQLESISISELYELYKDFYEQKNNQKALEQDLINVLKESVQVFKKQHLDPISLPLKMKAESKGEKKLKASSLRGDSRYVQMTCCQIMANNEVQFLDEYACDEVGEIRNTYTASVVEILGYGDSEKNLVSFMKAKHHNLRKIRDTKKAYKDFILLKEAVSPEKPIFLSYTAADLSAIGGESQAHPHAIYYALGQKQTIGAISINRVNMSINNEE